MSEPARVLLVEDDPRVAMMLVQMLRAGWDRGLVVIHAAGLHDAAQELLDHGASCVLLDPPAGMPVGDAVARLATASPDTPVIVVDGDVDRDAGLEAVRAGAQDFLAADELTAAALRRAVSYAVERKRSEVALARQALRDPLTGLPNRALFLDRLRGALDRTRRTGTPVVVLFLDVDDFKVINDSLGHAAGDRLMVMLADRFRGLMRPMDTVARFGGDEFTFLFEGLDGESAAEVLAQRIRHSAAQPLSLDAAPISVTVSIGVTIVSDPQAPAEEIINRADTAMYQAKRFGGGRYEVFETMTQTEAPTLEDELGHAVERSELRVHYQPRVSLDGETGLVGFEALVRWEHPERGLMEPAEFIGVAEESGLILPIGDWVLAQALHQVSEWRESRPEVTISVNLSSRQLIDPGLPVRLAETMRRGGHDPAILCLEVPEGVLEHDPEVACRQLAALNEMGIKLAIDDFGTGRSSASNLQQMPVHILKIDRTLVSGLNDRSAADAGVSAAVALGHALGLSVVAEGVETDDQLARLRELGCDGAQGYLFSEPMPEDCVDTVLSIG